MTNVTVFSTKGKKKSVVSTEATTWGELKKDLTEQGIDTNGVKAIVGETQTTLESSKAVLPKGLDIRGKITDNFTLFLTPIKVKSGNDNYINVDDMDYKGCRAFIKEQYAASEENKAYFGNYTHKSTDAMKVLIKGWLEANSEPVPEDVEDDMVAEYHIDAAIRHLNLLKEKIQSGDFNKEEVVDEVELLTQQWEEIKENL